MTDEKLLVEDFLFLKEIQGISDRHGKDMRKALHRWLRGGSLFDRTYILKSLCAYGNPHTFNLYLTYLNHFYRWCMEEGYLEKSPTRGLKRKRPQPRIVDLSIEEIRKFLAAIDTSSFAGRRNRLLCMTMLDTGIRPGEALSLLTSDIDLDKLEITVRGEVAKTSTERRLPCSLLIGKQFRGYLDTLSDMNAQKAFPDDSGGDLSMSTLYKFFQMTSRKSGVKVTAYCLRHAFALHSLRNGADPFWIQTMMGHSDLSMTKRYIALTKKDLRDTQRRVSPASRI